MNVLHKTLWLVAALGLVVTTVAMGAPASFPASVAEAEEEPCGGCDDEQQEESDCHEDCNAGCCMSQHAPSSAYVMTPHYFSSPIHTPLVTLSCDGEAARGYRDRVFQPPKA